MVWLRKGRDEDAISLLEWLQCPNLTEVMTPSGSLDLLPALQFIEDSIHRLRALSQCSVLENWRYLESSSELPWGQDSSWQTLPLATLNHRNHIAWSRGKQCLWLYQRFQWPADLNGFPIRGDRAKLALRWWADSAEIYVNGSHFQTGDLFDCFTRIPLTKAVEPEETVEVALKLISPGHDDGALVRSQLIFESSDPAYPEPGFFADEIAVLCRYLKEFSPHELPELAQKIEAIDWINVSDRVRFQTALQDLRQQLMPWSPWLKQRQIHCVGHAHLDLAWLWPIADTWDAAERTFQSVLSLQKDFPELTYTHSSPALFEWIEENRPELFQAIQAQVEAGRWAIDAGLWVEPDLNLIGGESIVRQILYGQRYCQEKFGQISAIAWLPDTFGFCWQLPQLLTQGGIHCFATQKLRWNDTNAFPYDWFWWEGLDGTRLLSLTLPLIGSDIEPVEMANYACGWESNTGLPHSLWLPGIGDHGGGPTRDMLEKAKRWAESPFFPELTFDHVGNFVRTLEASPTIFNSNQDLKNSSLSLPELPVWKDELYLELHRGCYTTHADQKWFNRRCEDLLYQAELFSSLATIIAEQPYPRAELEAAWKNVLFNQFHDILPGSSIPEVFTDANQLWQQTLQLGNELLQKALVAIAQVLTHHATTHSLLPNSLHPEAMPLLVFNSLNWNRTGVVSVYPTEPLRKNHRWQVQDATGQALPIQLIPAHSVDNNQSSRPQPFLFIAQEIPSVGYHRYWVSQVPESEPQEPRPSVWVLENQHLKVSIDPTNGNIASLFDKRCQREVLSGPGNQLQAFQDKGQYWDAWNIAPDYADHPLPPTQLKTIRWIEWGSIRQRLRVVRTLNLSEFTQDYILDSHSHILKIETRVNWQETQVLVKATFPLTVIADQATYEIPFGAIARPTTPQTTQEKAKWEVPALRWADLSEADYGVSLLTDCKHGFDASSGQLRLTLLKAALWPDPAADRGEHHFIYALYPHSGDWKLAQTAHAAHSLNIPLHCVTAPIPSRNHNETLLSRSQAFAIESTGTESFLELGNPNVILSAFKLAESAPHPFILRCYEAYGAESQIHLKSSLSLKLNVLVDGLENPVKEAKLTNPTCLSPWQIASYQVIRSP